MPSLVRPVRPARCVACAFDVSTMCGFDRAEVGSQWISHERQESITCVTFLIVIEDSATADASTTRAWASEPKRNVRALKWAATSSICNGGQARRPLPSARPCNRRCRRLSGGRRAARPAAYARAA
eukprot:scaffold26800_cov84-Phaeocystis_antarctica.AAC.3